jgi:hypothetical protein
MMVVLSDALEMILAVPEDLANMWTQLQSLEACDKVLKLSEPAFFLRKQINEIWIRDCYESLFDTIFQRYQPKMPERGVLVTGNPGIGKSFFLLYAMWRFVRLNITVIFESAEQGKVYLFKAGRLPNVAQGSPTMLKEIESEETVFLHDPKPGHEPLQVNAFTILASSPNPSNYKGFSKRNHSETFFLPVWTEQEIRSCNQALKSWNKTDEDISNGFSKFGGIPRFLLDQDKYTGLLQAAITTCRPQHIIQNAGAPDNLGEYSHKLLHYEVTSDFKAVTMNFASDFVFDSLTKQWEEDNKLALETFVMETSRAASLAGARGRAFEVAAHRYLLEVSICFLFVIGCFVWLQVHMASLMLCLHLFCAHATKFHAGCLMICVLT